MGAELDENEVRGRYGDRIERGLQGFARDPSYFVDMAEHGSLIAYKRSLYSVRREAEEAETRARAACEVVSKTRPFLCVAKSACGFGLCAFARGDLRSIRVAEGGAEARPEGVRARHTTYDSEAAVKALVELRGVTAPARLSRGRRRR